jgi:hypothetical protein
MPDTITYLVDMPGSEFNRYLDLKCRMPSHYFDELVPGEADYREGRLQNYDKLVGLDLTGVWTKIVLRLAYSALLEEAPSGRAAEIRSQIWNWERKLRELIPAIEIYRVASSLLDEWKGPNEETPIHADRNMRRFLDWLASREESGDYWCRLPEA